jgi:hypothetical protein
LSLQQGIQRHHEKPAANPHPRRDELLAGDLATGTGGIGGPRAIGPP